MGLHDPRQHPAAAFEAIAAMLPLGAVDFERKIGAKASAIWPDFVEEGISMV